MTLRRPRRGARSRDRPLPLKLGRWPGRPESQSHEQRPSCSQVTAGGPRGVILRASLVGLPPGAPPGSQGEDEGKSLCASGKEGESGNSETPRAFCSSQTPDLKENPRLECSPLGSDQGPASGGGGESLSQPGRQEEQVKPKVSRREETTKIRAHSNETENRHSAEN